MTLQKKKKKKKASATAIADNGNGLTDLPALFVSAQAQLIPS
jgi:hypothetical protein